MEGIKIDIDSDKINLTDSLSAQVGYCVGFIGFEYLVVTDQACKIVTGTNNGFNTERFNPIRVSLNDLLKYSEKTGEQEFDLFYTITETKTIYSKDQLHHLAHLVLK